KMKYLPFSGVKGSMKIS
ncbi:hypothetical protein A2U01_0074496, partial [Trifolium medium]|nr:hypothetical protein [Trifolium medium]